MIDNDLSNKQIEALTDRVELIRSLVGDDIISAEEGEAEIEAIRLRLGYV